MVKITVNMGLGEAVTNPKILDSGVADLALITGQKPIVTKSKKPSRLSSSRATRRLAPW